MIAKLRLMQFGLKSEKLDHQIEQLELQLEDLQADEAEAEREMPDSDRAPRGKSVRTQLPDHLPRDEKIYARGVDACRASGGGLRHLGEDVAEHLVYVPASFRVIYHVRPKLACSCCDAIVQAPGPSRPIEAASANLAYWRWWRSSPNTCRCIYRLSFINTLNLRMALARYCDDGQIDINTSAEKCALRRGRLEPTTGTLTLQTSPIAY